MAAVIHHEGMKLENNIKTHRVRSGADGTRCNSQSRVGEKTALQALRGRRESAKLAPQITITLKNKHSIQSESLTSASIAGRE